MLVNIVEKMNNKYLRVDICVKRYIPTKDICVKTFYMFFFLYKQD
jgi:hypothetical protein